MRLWKQLIISVIILVAGLAAVIRVVPAAAPYAVAYGVPANVVAMILQSSDEPAADNTGAGKRRGAFGGPALVVTQPVRLGKVNDQLNAIGDGDALQSVNVTPSVNGVLAEVVVRSGDRVKTGQLIARLDDDSETLAVEKAKVTLKSAEATLARNLDLKTIVPRADLDKSRTDAETAKLQLSEAELALKRRSILAPIDGVAGIVAVSNGDYVTTATSLVTIDNRSKLLVDFWVPERFSPMIAVGQPVEARAIARPGEVYNGEVSAIDSRIDQVSRTLHVQATIANNQDRLRAGMSFSVTMGFSGDAYPSVDPLTVQWDSKGSFVWRVVGDTAERVPVHIVERNSDSILVDAELKEGDAIITEGVQRVRDGGKVMRDGDTPVSKKPDAKKPTDESAEARP